ncbi:acylphosphatase [Clostridium hydrogenum]|uniref:acylphosphatase n=1 Tax=Clostridium hydrogenum TaxID=2855764 RepID=UPI001F3DEF1E|nr:acylphosphatase [Clostridium hydrogenum]
MERYLVKVCGRVQGVGFRYFVQYTAVSYDVTGYVQNCEDGTVKIEVQGKAFAVDEFLSKIRNGNRFARVEDMVSRKIEVVDGEKKFRVKY